MSSSYSSEEERTRLEERSSRELALVNQGTCEVVSTDTFDNYMVNFFRIDDPRIKSSLDSELTLLPSVHDDLKCVVEASLYVPENSMVTVRQLARTTFSNLKRIGRESTVGYVFASDFHGEHNIFAIKTAKEAAVGETDDLIHEVFIAFYCTNKLRLQIPNFMFIYGYFSCSYISEPNDVWCRSSGNSLYLLMEYVPGVTLVDFVYSSTVKVSQFMQVYIQVLGALALAYEEYQFTHYDLHTGNVIVRSFDADVAVPVSTPFGMQYLSTRLVPYIIDFGLSHIVYKGESFGPIGFEGYGIENNAFPMYDALKLLVGMYNNGYRSMSREGPAILALLEGCYTYVQQTTPDLPPTLKEMARFVSDLEHYEEIRYMKSSYSIRGYMQHVLSIYPIVFNGKPTELVRPTLIGENIRHVDIAHICRNLQWTTDVRKRQQLLLYLSREQITTTYFAMKNQLPRAKAYVRDALLNDIDDYKRACMCILQYTTDARLVDLLTAIVEDEI
jgi:hypothetical protein